MRHDTITLARNNLGVQLSPFTSPPVPLSSRRGGNKYSWGTPPDPRQREIPLDFLATVITRGSTYHWTPFTHVIARSVSDEAISGWWRDVEIKSPP